MAESSQKRVENTVGKGEIAGYEQFLLFQQCFQKTCTVDTSKNQGLFGKGLSCIYQYFTHNCYVINQFCRENPDHPDNR